ncbi:uncharacterized protein LOC142240224 [Haematobia irritans]|uniref:uncharacterized protein LOC142240224 n=1 Tax=Haematobia irritans TaxID=7368 RepID=UPI003F4F6AC9
MGCCNIRTLSLIVAWVHLILSAALALACLSFACVADSDYVKEDNLTETELKALFIGSIVGCIACAISVAFTVMLIAGIYQDRHRLMAPYVYMSYSTIVIMILIVVACFVYGFIDHQSVGDVFLNFLRNLIYLAFVVIVFSPIYLLYQKMRKGVLLPEHHALNSNEHVHKPMYSGHI